MRILYFYKECQTKMYQWQRFHIFDELEKHDCQIIVFNPLNYLTITEANEKLISFIKINKFDLFMTPYGIEDLYLETLLHIKRKGIPTLLICFDNLLIPFRHKQVACYFDLVWLTSKETQQMFINWGAKVIFNPYAANPFYFKAINVDEKNRIDFIGSPYGSRINTMNDLIKNEVCVSLFSDITSKKITPDICKRKFSELKNTTFDLMRFPIGRQIIFGAIKQKMIGNTQLNFDSNYLELQTSVPSEKFNEIYSGYALSLASTAARNTGILEKPINVVNLRSFEIPMCGGLQFCLYFDELAEYFEEDKEIIFYRSNCEMIEKAKFYLRPEKEALRMCIKQSARKRAENEHTWFIRFQVVFDYLGLKYL